MDAKFARYRARMAAARIAMSMVGLVASAVVGWLSISHGAPGAAFIVGATFALSAAALFRSIAADEARRKYG